MISRIGKVRAKRKEEVEESDTASGGGGGAYKAAVVVAISSRQVFEIQCSRISRKYEFYYYYVSSFGHESSIELCCISFVWGNC